MRASSLPKFCHGRSRWIHLCAEFCCRTSRWWSTFGCHAGRDLRCGAKFLVPDVGFSNRPWLTSSEGFRKLFPGKDADRDHRLLAFGSRSLQWLHHLVSLAFSSSARIPSSPRAKAGFEKLPALLAIAWSLHAHLLFSAVSASSNGVDDVEADPAPFAIRVVILPWRDLMAASLRMATSAASFGVVWHIARTRSGTRPTQ